MADFLQSFVTTTAASLVGSESGLITQNGGFFVDGSDAITTTFGTNWLHVLGTVYAYDGGFAAVDADGGVFEMVVGQTGYVSAENPTGGVLDVDLSTHFDLTNHGIIHSANNDAVDFNDTDGAANFNLDNFGTISANGSDALDIDVGTGNMDIINHGTITAGGDAMRLFAAAAATDQQIINHGNISSAEGVGMLMIFGGGGMEVFIQNTGEISGDGGGLIASPISNDADYRIINSGTITALSGIQEAIQTAAGDDEIINTGALVGDVEMWDGNDLYDGRDGAINGDVLGGLGNDTILTSDQEDVVSGDEGNDRIKTYGGDDYIQGGDNNDNIYAGDGDDEVIAGTGNDILRGGLGDDDLNGGAGRDTIRGGSGDDIIFGARNGDMLSGGSGADVFVYNNANQSSLGDRDEITDFMQGADLIDISAFGATFIGTAGFSGTGVEVRYGTGGGLTRFEVDVDGNGTADMRVDMGAIGALSADDFIL